MVNLYGSSLISRQTYEEFAVAGHDILDGNQNSYQYVGTTSSVVIVSGGAFDYEDDNVLSGTASVVFGLKDRYSTYQAFYDGVKLEDLIGLSQQSQLERIFSGDDLIRGSLQLATNDELLGFAGNDLIDGGMGNDEIEGGLGNDTINGGIGRDKIDGSEGRDVIWGGSKISRDTLIGGSEADRFVFGSIYDSTVSNYGRDVIKDFKHRDHDRIDLRSIDANSNIGGNQSFAFIGKKEFGRQAGEIHYRFTSGGDTLIEGDVGGDGKPNFSILIDGLVNLHKDDFFL